MSKSDALEGTFTPEALRSTLSTTLLGRRIEIHPQVGSTNDLIREAARKGEREGLVIAAEEQIAGRGRLGRVWTAPPGCCILCSVLLRPIFSPQHAFYLTIATSLAIYRALKTMDEGQQSKTQAPASGYSKSKIAVKWPNDVLIGGRKVAGILCESEFVGGDWVFAVVGFGINVNLSLDELGDLKETATSLYVGWGEEVDRLSLLASVLTELEELYLALQRREFSAVYEEWADALETIGRRVMVREGAEEFDGEALRVETDGALIVRMDYGQERRVLAGDVTLSPVREDFR